MKTFTKATVASGLFAASVHAQYSIDPNSVSNNTRNYWCVQQQAACPLICLDQGADSGTLDANDCDPQALTYACVCDNGLSPNLSEYSQTLPYFLCTEWGTQCVSNCGGDVTCESACRQNHPCGAQNPTRQNTSTLTSTMAPTTTASGSASDVSATTDSAGVTIYSGFGGGSGGAANTAEPGSSAAASSGTSQSSASKMVRVWALSAGQTFGTVGLIGAAALGFAVLL